MLDLLKQNTLRNKNGKSVVCIINLTTVIEKKIVRVLLVFYLY